VELFVAQLLIVGALGRGVIHGHLLAVVAAGSGDHLDL
jgi:hypothetical protein